MKGIVVKKKPVAVATKPTQSAKKPMTIGEKDDADLAARAENKREAEDEDTAVEKKQKVDSTWQDQVWKLNVVLVCLVMYLHIPSHHNSFQFFNQQQRNLGQGQKHRDGD